MFNHWQIQGGWAKGAVLALLELRAMCKIGEGGLAFPNRTLAVALD